MEYSFPFSWVALSVLVAILLARAIQKLWRITSEKSGNEAGKIALPRGSSGLPFVGETISFFRAINTTGSDPRQFAQERVPKYGPVFRSNLFGYGPQTVVSIDAEFNKYVMQNEGRLFEANYPASTKHLFGKYGLVCVHGDLHRKLHGTAMNLMKPEKLASDFMEDIQNAISTAMNKWQDKPRISLLHECNQMVLNLMGKKLLDLPPAEEMQELYTAFKDFMGALVVLPLNFPGSAYSKGMKARETIVKHIHKCIEERRNNPNVVRNDLLSKLLKEESYSDEIITDLLVFMLFAGYETSSTAMAFTIKFLTSNTLALQEIRAEHDTLLKAKGEKKLTWEDYGSMKFTHCVIKETLRRANVVPGIPRKTKQDIKFKDFVIPKGWTVFVFMNAMHLDDKNFSDPLEFNPWSWQDEGQEMKFDKAHFMPFGRGGRLCPGYHLARFEIALFLHTFLTKFTWEEAEKDQINYFPSPHMVKGLPLRLYPRH